MERLTNLLNCTLDSNSSHFSLKETYEELKIRNVVIPFNLQVEVETRLLEFNFLTKKSVLQNDDFKSFKHIKEHLDFVCFLMETFLLKYFGKDVEPDLEFVFHARYIAQNMAVLKQRLGFSYKILPWEEMQFCLVIYLYSLQTSTDSTLVYKLVLDQNRLLKHLQQFYTTLKLVQQDFREEHLQTKRGVNRNLLEKTILQNTPQFKYLYKDFRILRNIYSLVKINRYLEQALSVNLFQNYTVGQLVIERTLQVTGEYLKNSVDSPNLSEDLYNLLLRSAPRNLRSILVSVRNMLSHAFSLSRKLEIEESNDNMFFKNIQRDLKKVHNEIIYIIYQQKTLAVRIFLKKMLNQNSLIDIQRLFSKVKLKKLKIDGISHNNTEDFLKVKQLINLFCEEVLKELPEDANLIEEIKEILKFYPNKLSFALVAYKDAINKLYFLSKMLDELPRVHIMGRTYLSTLTSFRPQSLFVEIFEKLRNIHERFKAKRNYDVNNLLGNDEKAIKAGKIILKIYAHLRWGMRKIPWIEEMEMRLSLKPDVTNEKIDKITRMFTIFKNNLDNNEDRNIFQDFVEQKIKQHLCKSKLIGSIDKDRDTFETTLKCLNLNIKRHDDIVASFEKKKFDKLQIFLKEINDDYGILVKQLGDIFPLNKYINPIKTFLKSLKLKKSLQEKVFKVCDDYVQNEVFYSYNKRLEMLKGLIGNIQVKVVENNKHLKIALEMLVLDMLEYLENIKILSDNKLFLIESLPILKGKQLRNFLAHGDLLTEILPYNTVVSIVFHANYMVSLSGAILGKSENMTLGNNASSKNVCSHNDFNKCVTYIKLQEELFKTVESGNYLKVMELIKKTESDGTNFNGLTALNFAINSKNAEIIDLFLISNAQQITVLYNCLKKSVLTGHFTTFNYILNKFKADLNHKFNKNMTLLLFALKYGHTIIASFLIENGANVNDRTVNGKTALMFAARCGNEQLVQLLLDNDTELTNAVSDSNTTALHIAAKNNYDKIVMLLLNKKACPYIKNNEDLTGFELAAMHGHINVVNVFLEEKTFNLSLEILTKAASLAAETGHLNTIWPLIQNKYKINNKNTYGDTILHRATLYGHQNVVSLLTKNMKNINVCNSSGCTPLHLACRCGHTEVVNILLANGADVNTKDHKEWTPLHWATYIGHGNVAELLLSNHASAVIFDKNGKTALHLAVEMCNLKILNIILKNSANDANIATQDGRSALHIAAENGDWSIINLLLYTYHVDVNLATKNNETPLILAANNGHLDVVEHLLKHGATVNGETKTEKFTALTRATIQGYTDIVILLLKSNANIEHQDSYGWRAIHYASQNGYTDIVDILLKYGVDFNAQYAHNGTALHTAISSGHTHIVRKLINLGANINGMVLNLLPLRIAANYGYKDIVLMLLEKGTNVNACGNDNVSSLHTAAWNGHLDVVKILLENGANINSQTDEQWTALHFVAKFGFIDIASYLVNSGADINIRNNNETTAFHISCENGYLDIVSLLLKTQKVNVDDANINGWTSLHWASAGGHNNIVKQLISHGASVNKRANDLSTPLHWAVQYVCSIEVVNTLIENNANINLRDAKGSMPLHIAALNGNDRVVEVLLQNGADVNADNKLVTALHLASSFGHSQIVKELLTNGAKVNSQGLYQKTSLHLAVEKCFEDIVITLINSKADVNMVDQFNLTPLHVASQKGYYDIIKLLINAKSDVHALDNNGYSSLYFAVINNHDNISQLLIKNTIIYDLLNDGNGLFMHVAAKNGMIKTVESLIDRGVDIDKKYSPVATTPLLESLFNNYEDVAMLFIKNNANVNISNCRGWTPLHIATGKGYKKITNQLINAGADVNAETLDKETPLHFASLQGHYDIVADLLLRSADVNVKTNSNGYTALSVAAQEGHFQVMVLLLKHKANINIKGKQGLTPLHLSTLYGHKNSVNVLLQHKADITAKTDNNWTPLHLAVAEGFLEIVQLLLQYKINLNDYTDEGSTPLLLAVEQGNIDIVQELLKYPSVDLKLKGKHGLTAIELASQKEFDNIFKILLASVKDDKDELK